MTQEDKDLVLKDLCARLPYGVWAEAKLITSASSTSWLVDALLIHSFKRERFDIYKPYLFPLSSMTEEQERELEKLDPEFYTVINNDGSIECTMNNKTFDWFHKNHFDWRGLIPMGLANDATGLNIY